MKDCKENTFDRIENDNLHESDGSGFLTEDLPRLKQIWKDGFGDTDDDIEAFFSLLFDPEAVYITRENGIPVSVMYLVEGLMLSEMPEGKPVKVTYLYALASKWDKRGRGYGRRTVRGAADLAFARGADIVALTPADAGLRDWYRANVGFEMDSLTKEEYEHLFKEHRERRPNDACTNATGAKNGSGGEFPCHVVFKRNFLELQELYSWGETEVKDTVIYEVREGVEVPGFYWGPTLS